MTTKNDRSGKSPDASPEGVVGTFSEIFEEFTTLVQTELRLLRAELSETVAAIGLGMALVAGGAVLLMAAAVLLLQAIIAGLIAYGWSLPVATLLVATVVLTLGLILLLRGVAALRLKNLAPSKTINQLEQDVAVIKSEVGAS